MSLIAPRFTESVIVRSAEADVTRFEYFRHLERIAYGKVPPESLLDVQELYDTSFRTSEAWDRARKA
ncbi:hypothetical protein GCM10010149_42600 [Nonomuraea roseoviolacea subsp. roseoviolacea]|uniref:DUF5753 domain-containing protein n=1 Tax=Nonomuraea roseoviolacea subsp. carminata TaxID=160689 RepID=A0ABT1JYH5_9ACTN|nr:hypothetical protein [Nonomuraea roseoviolacea]MCP2346808.1 hypothetical protein [Nonomuraea roseoviolacea subsp. carminata]